jgi:hypothetical protein
VREVTNVRIIDRSKAGLMTVLIALSLLLSALPASAGTLASRGMPTGWDFLDPTGLTWEKTPKNITWEKTPKNITWEKVLPGNITWENALRTITWE